MIEDICPICNLILVEMPKEFCSGFKSGIKCTQNHYYLKGDVNSLEFEQIMKFHNFHYINYLFRNYKCFYILDPQSIEICYLKGIHINLIKLKDLSINEILNKTNLYQLFS